MRTLRFGATGWLRYLASLPRGGAATPGVERAVASILADVRRNGDGALVRLTERFDGVRLTPATLRVPPAEVRGLARRAAPPLVAALREMARRIEAFHRRQRDRGFRLPLAGVIVTTLCRRWKSRTDTVSYTHLTLPTILLV